MADTITTIPRVEPGHAIEQRVQQRSALWHRLALAAIMLISVFMNFFQLGQNGFGSYYPAAVRSMMDNWHNFFFASYDPGGFVSIDKPPVGFWLQVLSAKLFGFTAFSILLPQAWPGCSRCSCSITWCAVTLGARLACWQPWLWQSARLAS